MSGKKTLIYIQEKLPGDKEECRPDPDGRDGCGNDYRERRGAEAVQPVASRCIIPRHNGLNCSKRNAGFIRKWALREYGAARQRRPTDIVRLLLSGTRK